MRCTVRDKENAYYPAGALAPRPGAFYQQGTGRWAVSFGSISKPTQAYRRGSALAPHEPVQVGGPLSEHQREGRTSIPSCRSVFVRPAGLLPGSLMAHRPRQRASLHSVQGARPLRRSAAIPPDAVISFSPCQSCEAWSHAVRRVRLDAKRPVQGLGNPNKRMGISKTIFPCPACSSYRKFLITRVIRNLFLSETELRSIENTGKGAK